MASQQPTDDVVSQLQQLSVDDASQYPACAPSTNVVDRYRLHITDLLHEASGVDKKIIYPAVAWTSTLDKGDLIVAVPALRVKGKPDELAAQWIEKVGEGPFSDFLGLPPTSNF